MIGSLLHWGSVALCFGGFFVLLWTIYEGWLLAWKWSKKTSKASSEMPQTTNADSRVWKSNWFPIEAALTLAGVMCAALGWAAHTAVTYTYPVFTHHNVKALKYLGGEDWLVHDDEEGTHLYRGCPDFPNEDVIKAGYVADHVIYEEQGACKSIRRDGLGWYWKLNGHDRVVQIQEARN